MTNDPINDVIECSQVPGIHEVIAQIEHMSSQAAFVDHGAAFCLRVIHTSDCDPAAMPANPAKIRPSEYGTLMQIRLTTIAVIAAIRCGRLRIIGAIIDRNAMGRAKSIGRLGGSWVPSAAPRKLQMNHAPMTKVHVPK